MQGVCARTAIIVCIVIGVNATLSIDDIVPCILLANILMDGIVGAVIDNEVECVNVSAS